MNNFKYKDFYHSVIYTIETQRLIDLPLPRTNYVTLDGRLGDTQKVQDEQGPCTYSTCQVSPCNS